MFLKVVTNLDNVELCIFGDVSLETFNPFNYGVIWLLIKTKDQALLLFRFRDLIFQNLVLFVLAKSLQCLDIYAESIP